MKMRCKSKRGSREKQKERKKNINQKIMEWGEKEETERRETT